MIQKIKKYLKTAGWLFLQPNVLAYDKQAHGILSVWLTLFTFFVPQNFGMTTPVAALLSIVLVSLIGFGIEFYQKWFTTDRVFDVKDATIMIKVNLIMLLVFNVWMVIAGTSTWSI